MDFCPMIKDTCKGAYCEWFDGEQSGCAVIWLMWNLGDLQDTLSLILKEMKKFNESR